MKPNYLSEKSPKITAPNITPKKKKVAVAWFKLLCSQTRSHWKIDIHFMISFFSSPISFMFMIITEDLKYFKFMDSNFGLDSKIPFWW